MEKNSQMSRKTRIRYLTDLVMFILFIGVFASSLYFLYVPSGYQGGRNPRYNMRILFERGTWGAIHKWTGLMLSVILIFHVFLHVNWIQRVFLRYIQLWKKSIRRGNLLRIMNVLVDGLAAIAFFICLFSGLILLLVPGGRGTATIKIVGIMRESWKTFHTWSGIAMFASVFLHLAIHWNWTRKVGVKFFASINHPIEAFAKIIKQTVS